jgi:hypothetical protein
MAELSLAEYEAALDDITRRGVDDILHTHHPKHTRTVPRRPISPQRLRKQRPLPRIEPPEPAETTPIRARPYATIAVAGLIGFACAALRR